MKATKKSRVSVHYTGRLESGEVFDTSAERGPLELTLGEGQFLDAFENAIVGMEVGQKKKDVRLNPAEAYGPTRDDMLLEVSWENVPDNMRDLKEGDRITLIQGEEELPVAILDIREGEKIVMDANHPLAGKAIFFEIELLEILELGAEEASE